MKYSSWDHLALDRRTRHAIEFELPARRAPRLRTLNIPPWLMHAWHFTAAWRTSIALCLVVGAIAFAMSGCSDLPPRGVVTDQLVQVAAVDSEVACPAHGPCRLRKLILLPEIVVYGHKRMHRKPHGRVLMAQAEPLDPVPLSTIF